MTEYIELYYSWLVPYAQEITLFMFCQCVYWLVLGISQEDRLGPITPGGMLLSYVNSSHTQLTIIGNIVFTSIAYLFFAWQWSGLIMIVLLVIPYTLHVLMLGLVVFGIPKLLYKKG